MKYTEFLELKDILELAGTSIAKELNLNEATLVANQSTNISQPDTVDTKGAGLGFFSRWGQMKTTLNRQGKNLQNKINKQIIGKYLPNMVESELTLANDIKDALASSKQPDEIKTVVKSKREQVAAIQKQQLQILSKTIEGFLNNSGARLDKKIEASKMKDKNKLDLKNYWLLLKSQIHMNALRYMQKIITSKVKEVLGDNAAAIKLYQETTPGSTLDTQIQTKKTDIDKNAQVIKTAEAEMKAGGDQGTPVAVELKEGGKYKYTKKDGTVEEVTIRDILPNGNIVVKPDIKNPYTVEAARKDKFATIETVSSQDQIEAKREVDLTNA